MEKGLNLQNLQIAHAAQYQKNKQPSQKMNKYIFLQRRQMTKKQMERSSMSQIITEMQIQNHSEVRPHASQNGRH